MDRRNGLQTATLATGSAKLPLAFSVTPANTGISNVDLKLSPAAEIDGHMLVCGFTQESTHWKTYEDLPKRGRNHMQRILRWSPHSLGEPYSCCEKMASR